MFRLVSLGVFLRPLGGVWGGKAVAHLGRKKENTKISARRKTSKNGRSVGEEGSFCSREEKGQKN